MAKRERAATSKKKGARRASVDEINPFSVADAPTTREMATSLLAAGIQGAHGVQKALFGGEPVPKLGLLLLDLARAQIGLSYTLMKASHLVVQQALDKVTPAHVPAPAPAPAQPPPAPAGGNGEDT
jgi:hypothetical protein